MSDPAPSSRRESKGFELTENIERMVHVRKGRLLSENGLLPRALIHC